MVALAVGCYLLYSYFCIPGRANAVYIHVWTLGFVAGWGLSAVQLDKWNATSEVASKASLLYRLAFILNLFVAYASRLGIRLSERSLHKRIQLVFLRDAVSDRLCFVRDLHGLRYRISSSAFE
jgi:hypothetical protein